MNALNINVCCIHANCISYYCQTKFLKNMFIYRLEFLDAFPFFLELNFFFEVFEDVFYECEIFYLDFRISIYLYILFGN
jgi:hypothetical protein